MGGQGERGRDGSDGVHGSNGNDGYDGVRGPTGAEGSRGASFYVPSTRLFLTATAKILLLASLFCARVRGD